MNSPQRVGHANAMLIAEEGAEFMGPGSHLLIGYETLVHGEPVPGLPTEKFYEA